MAERTASSTPAGWLECVPNVSEGRRREVIERLAAAAASAPPARLLDVSSDPDHDRSVLTLAGPASALHAALLAVYQEALAAIDLAVHAGIHPRIGAVDVVPFVPLPGSEMASAVAAARRLGAAVAERFDLPVFLYGEAARREEHRDLAVLRRGGLDGVARRLAGAAASPEFGPSRLHPTGGATAVGARFYLIAFNAQLASADVEVARRIATAIRERDGGLPGVKALGLRLASRNCAQVSVNLTDFRRTSLGALVARIEEEAARLGTAVADTEIVGLAPEAALDATLRRTLRLVGGEDPANRILERKLIGDR